MEMYTRELDGCPKKTHGFLKKNRYYSSETFEQMLACMNFEPCSLERINILQMLSRKTQQVLKLKTKSERCTAEDVAIGVLLLDFFRQQRVLLLDKMPLRSVQVSKTCAIDFYNAPQQETAEPGKLEGVGLIKMIESNLIKTRKETKKIMKKEKDPDVKANLDALQKALKTAANSIYGFFAAQLYNAWQLSAATTALGRKLTRDSEFFANFSRPDPERRDAWVSGGSLEQFSPQELLSAINLMTGSNYSIVPDHAIPA